MIQRVQSVYLFVAAIFCALMFAFTLWEAQIPPSGSSVTKPEKTYQLDVFFLSQHQNGQMQVLHNTWWLAAISGLTAAMAMGAVFLYTNRLLQIKIARLCILLLAVQIVLIFYHIYEAKDIIGEGHSEFYDAGIYFPVGAIVFLFLSGRAIMKDERMVRAADRLR